MLWGDGFTAEDVTSALPLSEHDEHAVIGLTTHLPLRKYDEEENAEFLQDMEDSVVPQEFRDFIVDEETGEMKPRGVDINIGDMRPLFYPGTRVAEEEKKAAAAQAQAGGGRGSQ